LALYTTEHYTYGYLDYIFSLPANTYSVKLYFNSRTANHSGTTQLLQNISANGTPIVSNWSAFDAAGGVNLPYILTTSVTVGSNRTLDLKFVPYEGDNWPDSGYVSAIEVVPTGPART
jgi:hypothetical protein